MECELCGKDSFNLREIDLDGVKLMVCESCYKPYEKKTELKEKNVFTPKGKKINNPTEFKEFDRIILVPNWGKLIRKKREEKGLTVKELSEKLFERESIMHKIENEKIKPGQKLIKKIEDFFNIKLIQEEENNFVQETSEKELTGFTLMDFVKKKK